MNSLIGYFFDVIKTIVLPNLNVFEPASAVHCNNTAEEYNMKHSHAQYLLISSCLVVSGCGVLKDVTQPLSLDPTSAELSPGRHQISAISDTKMSGIERFAEKAREACGGDYTVEERSSPPRVTGIVACAKEDPASAKKMLKAGQQKLADMGYNPGPVDGVMGSKTERAIKRFQRDYKLEQTGTLDAKTLNILNM